MPLAVVQNDLTDPTVEQLVAAFGALPELTDHDAMLRARDVSGVIADRLDEKAARTLLGALAQQGVAAAIIDEDDLPQLPPPYRTLEVIPDDAELIVLDAMNQPMAINWPCVALIAAGLVNHGEFVTVDRPSYAAQNDAGAGYVVHNRSRLEQQSTGPLIEIHLTVEPGRVRIRGEKHRYGYLGADKPIDKIECYETLVLDLARRAPNAPINRGADAIVRGTRRRTYRSMRTFEREAAWLMWLTGSANPES